MDGAASGGVERAHGSGEGVAGRQRARRRAGQGRMDGAALGGDVRGKDVFALLLDKLGSRLIAAKALDDITNVLHLSICPKTLRKTITETLV